MNATNTATPVKSVKSAKVASVESPASPSVPSMGSLLTSLCGEVRCQDVLSAAADFAPFVSEAAKTETSGKQSAIARKAAKVAQSKAFALRVTLAAYSLAKIELNPTQRAELAAKLPELATGGKLSDRAITFGGIVLPPLAGEV